VQESDFCIFPQEEMNIMKKITLFTMMLAVLLCRPVNADMLVAGERHSAYLDDKGVVYTWGSYNAFSEESNPLPSVVENLPEIMMITASGDRTAFLSAINEVYVLGSSSPDAPTLLDITDGIVSIALGFNNLVVLTNEGKVYNFDLVTGLLIDTGIENATSISADSNEFLTDTGLALVEGTVYVWGENTPGQVAMGEFGDEATIEPTPIVGLPFIEKISAANNHILLVDIEGNVWTFGEGLDGQLGNGMTYSTEPVKIEGMTDIVDVAGGRNHSLAVDKEGQLFVFGLHNLIDEASTLNAQDFFPRLVPGAANIELIAAGGDHSLIKSDGEFFGWGENQFGQIGDGTFESRHEFSLISASWSNSSDMSCDKETDSGDAEEEDEATSEESPEADECGFGVLISDYADLEAVLTQFTQACSDRGQRKRLKKALKIGDGHYREKRAKKSEKSHKKSAKKSRKKTHSRKSGKD